MRWHESHGPFHAGFCSACGAVSGQDKLMEEPCPRDRGIWRLSAVANCRIVTPKAAMGPTMKALAEGHRARDCPVCNPKESTGKKVA